MFDEPSSYLDVKQRLNAAKALRSLILPTKYIVVVEHDLSVLDYLSDFICCLYGIPGVYGVVTVINWKLDIGCSADRGLIFFFY